MSEKTKDLNSLVRPVYLACMRWPTYDEPLLIGTNKRFLARAAKMKAVAMYGDGLVLRPQAMCSAKITLDDIGVELIEVLREIPRSLTLGLNRPRVGQGDTMNQEETQAGSELSDVLGNIGSMKRLLGEFEVAMKHTQRWSYWKPLIAAALREYRMNEAAFDAQTRELETACQLLIELGPEHMLEYRLRAHPKFYPRPET